ncbi:CHAP domain-containing protein [Pedobacter jeongneungensis]|uniref:CHAP domain-containing protein n=1 Tax=Pedobacter jeongneungensis TaxID=947309 RepID=UPI00046A5EDD|nr:CHAP domain-containing protein [Pedobacter jeongneungensis]
MIDWISVAQKQIGVEEYPKGSNGGKQVEVYLKAVGLGKGYAWCMAFVYWCVLQACTAKGLKMQLKRTGGVNDQYIACKSLAVNTPQAGDIFIMLNPNGTGHTGFIEKVLGNGIVQTIEGNTNADGSREGYQVARRTRNIKTIKAYIRLNGAV